MGICAQERNQEGPNHTREGGSVKGTDRCLKGRKPIPQGDESRCSPCSHHQERTSPSGSRTRQPSDSQGGSSAGDAKISGGQGQVPEGDPCCTGHKEADKTVNGSNGVHEDARPLPHVSHVPTSGMQEHPESVAMLNGGCLPVLGLPLEKAEVPPEQAPPTPKRASCPRGENPQPWCEGEREFPDGPWLRNLQKWRAGRESWRRPSGIETDLRLRDRKQDPAQGRNLVDAVTPRVELGEYPELRTRRDCLQRKTDSTVEHQAPGIPGLVTAEHTICNDATQDFTLNLVNNSVTNEGRIDQVAPPVKIPLKGKMKFNLSEGKIPKNPRAEKVSPTLQDLGEPEETKAKKAEVQGSQVASGKGRKGFSRQGPKDKHDAMKISIEQTSPYVEYAGDGTLVGVDSTQRLESTCEGCTGRHSPTEIGGEQGARPGPRSEEPPMSGNLKGVAQCQSKTTGESCRADAVLPRYWSGELLRQQWTLGTHQILGIAGQSYGGLLVCPATQDQNDPRARIVECEPLDFQLEWHQSIDPPVDRGNKPGGESLGGGERTQPELRLVAELGFLEKCIPSNSTSGPLDCNFSIRWNKRDRGQPYNHDEHGLSAHNVHRSIASLSPCFPEGTRSTAEQYKDKDLGGAILRHRRCTKNDSSMHNQGYQRVEAPGIQVLCRHKLPTEDVGGSPDQAQTEKRQGGPAERSEIQKFRRTTVDNPPHHQEQRCASEVGRKALATVAIMRNDCWRWPSTQGPGWGIPQWWRYLELEHPSSPFCTMAARDFPYDNAGGLKFLQVQCKGQQIWAFMDTGASHSFVSIHTADDLQLKETNLPQRMRFVLGSGGCMPVETYVPDLTIIAGELTSTENFIVAGIPYPMILGRRWMIREKLEWQFEEDVPSFWKGGRRIMLPTELINSKEIMTSTEKQKLENDRHLTKVAHRQLLAELERMPANEAGALVRRSPKRYKNFKNASKRVQIKHILRIAEEQHNKGTQVMGEKFLILLGLKETSPMGKIPGEVYEGVLLTLEDEEELNNKSFNESKARGYTRDEWPGGHKGGKREEAFEHFETWVEAQLKEATIDAGALQVLKSFPEMFQQALPTGLPHKRVTDHHVPLLPGVIPAKGRVFRMGAELEKEQKKILQNLLEGGKITHTSSPFAAPSMMVSKKDDAKGKRQYRMVINYQGLNAITIAAEYPVPTIMDMLEKLHGAKVFTIMDMEQGFHQIRMAPEDQYKTAFRTFLGQYEFKVMPFGLKGAPGTFQAVMNHMFFEHIGVFVVVYLDDLLIYSKNMKDHIVHLEIVLKLLKFHQLFPKLLKCLFAVSVLEYLGYTISQDGITPSKDKVKAIELWPEQLENDTQVKQFLGTLNYCRMFMGMEYTELALPLLELTKKGVEFVWTDEHTKSVQELKKRLVNYTTLQIPDSSKPYELWTDASGYAIGAVLEQEGKPLSFMSKKMSPVQMRYSVYDQELLALVSALEKWKHLLRPAKVTVFTDHKALEYLQQIKAEKPLRGKTARWLDLLADYQDMTIVYKPGATNIVADAMSRCPLHARDFPLITIAPGPTAENATPDPAPGIPIGSDEWQEAVSESEEFREAYAAAKAEAPRRITAKAAGIMATFKMPGKFLLIKRGALWRICAPSQAVHRMRIMFQHHDHPTAGHLGMNKTYSSIAKCFYWKGMKQYVKTYVDTCSRCRQSKSISQKPAGLLNPLQIPTRRWAFVSLDFITGLPVTSTGFDSILTIVDSLSKMVHFVPTTKNVSAAGVVELLADRLVRYHGLPEKIVSDRDPRFTGELWGEMCKRFQIKRAMSTAFHPQTDGQTERVHRTVEQILRNYIQEDETEWINLLPAVELGYNCTSHSSTGKSPFEVMIGENPLRAQDLALWEQLAPISTPPMTRLFQMMVDRATAHITRAQHDQKEAADRRRRHVEFNVGEKVWVSTKHMLLAGCPKFKQRYIGPFPIQDRVGEMAYRLILPRSMLIHNVFHVSLLQKAAPIPADMPRTSQPWLPVMPPTGGEAEYEVENILDIRGISPNEEYKIKWRGFTEEQATWEPIDNLAHCTELLRAFHANLRREQRTNSNSGWSQVS